MHVHRYTRADTQTYMASAQTILTDIVFYDLQRNLPLCDTNPARKRFDPWLLPILVLTIILLLYFCPYLNRKPKELNESG